MRRWSSSFGEDDTADLGLRCLGQGRRGRPGTRRGSLGRGTEEHGDVKYVYDLDEPLETKIEKIVKRIYGGERANFLRSAKRVTWIRYAIGVTPTSRCAWQRPRPHCPTTRGSGTGRQDSRSKSGTSRCAAAPALRVVYTGEIMTMPGLPSTPAAAAMDIDNEGNCHRSVLMQFTTVPLIKTSQE